MRPLKEIALFCLYIHFQLTRLLLLNSSDIKLKNLKFLFVNKFFKIMTKVCQCCVSRKWNDTLSSFWWCLSMASSLRLKSDRILNILTHFNVASRCFTFLWRIFNKITELDEANSKMYVNVQFKNKKYLILFFMIFFLSFYNFCLSFKEKNFIDFKLTKFFFNIKKNHYFFRVYYEKRIDFFGITLNLLFIIFLWRIG